MLVKMTRYDGMKVDVHPDMVDDYKKGGYVVDDVQPAIQKPHSPTDAEMRDAIEKATGVRPHHKVSRDNLLKTYREL